MTTSYIDELPQKHDKFVHYWTVEGKQTLSRETCSESTACERLLSSFMAVRPIWHTKRHIQLPEPVIQKHTRKGTESKQ